MHVLGIDYVGNEIRAGLVDVEKGRLDSTEFVSFPIIEHTPSRFLSRVHEIVKLFKWKGIIGVGFPAPVKQGIILRPPYLDDMWEDMDIQLMLSEMTDLTVFVYNGMDCMAWAEMNYGAGADAKGTTVLLSVGPIILSSIFFDKTLFPNSELGIIEMNGVTANERASNKTRKEEGLKRRTWAKRIQYVLDHYEDLLNPDHVILCGEVCHKADKVIPFIETRFAEIKEASLFKYSGMIGAAVRAYQASQKTT
ncbi:ROK family protein [bacterium]|nr:MAG: ROK family protein [bacterium]